MLYVGWVDIFQDFLLLQWGPFPLAVEYKKVASAVLINQSLCYLNWISNHAGDFAIGAIKEPGKKVAVVWSDMMISYLAAEYKLKSPF